MPRRRKLPKEAEGASQSSQGLPPQQAAQGRGQQVSQQLAQGRGQQPSQQPVEEQPFQEQRVSPAGQQSQTAHGRGQGLRQQASQRLVEAQPSQVQVQRVSSTGQQLIMSHGRGLPRVFPRGPQAAAAPGRAQQVQQAPSEGVGAFPGRGLPQVCPCGPLAAAPPGRAQQVQQAPSQGVGAFPGRAGGQGPQRGGGPTLATTLRQPYVAASSSGKSPVDVTEQLQKTTIHGPTLPPDQVVGTSTSQVHGPSSSKNMQFPRRPGSGKVGSICIVKANHFKAELPDKDLHQYDVSITQVPYRRDNMDVVEEVVTPQATPQATPQVLPQRVNRDVMDQLVKDHQDSALGRRLPAYDGQKILYTAGALPFKSKEFIIKLEDKDDGTGAPRRQREFKVAIKFAAQADLHHLGEFLNGRQARSPQEVLQALDVVLRELPTRRSLIGPPLERPSIGQGLECWRGFCQSIRPTQMGLSLNIDVSSTAFLKPLLVTKFVAELLHCNDVPRQLEDADLIKITKALRGVKIEVTHRDPRSKYKILGLTSKPTQELTFTIDDKGTNDKGRTMSVVQYFQDKYNRTIEHKGLPCLQMGTEQRPNYLPMEVCKIAKEQRYTKQLNKHQITALLKVTCPKPVDRERDIVKAVEDNDYAEDPYAKEFGIEICNKLEVVEARILPAPQLRYNNRVCQPKLGKWDMKDKKLFNGGVVSSWTCITFSQAVPISGAERFCEELAKACKAYGMTFHEDPVIAIRRAPPLKVESALRQVYQEIKNLHPEKELDLLVAILPDNNGTLYGDLKRVCETELGFISQCILTKQVLKGNHQIWANLVLKINAKVGGRNTVLVDALTNRIPRVTDKPTIIFGADVTHPHPGEDSSPSIAAVVASQDWPEVTKYAGLVCAQEHRKEIIQDLRGMTRHELYNYLYQNTKRRPERIIFYRDGVSEGQFLEVLKVELDAIQKACASLDPSYKPLPITFVVVQKRHHTRLFPYNHDDKNSIDSSGNICPGTVVDSRICHPTEFDFYLCSHAGIQGTGTSRPAHYHVLWDDNNFTADGLQQLTNNLCYTYACCTRSVSIVPPAYYAHRAAFRARFYMKSGSDSGSVTSGNDGAGSAGSRSTGAGPAVGAAFVQPLPPVTENVKKLMFFC